MGDFVFNHPAPAAASVLGRPTGLVTDRVARDGGVGCQLRGDVARHQDETAWG